MERLLWKGRIKNGMRDEYIRRHDEIWPEMVSILKKAGIQNYSIWLDENDEITGYYECESVVFASQVQVNSDVVKRWDEYMKDILEFIPGKNNGERIEEKQVFYLE